MKTLLRTLFVFMFGFLISCCYQSEIYKHNYYNLELVNRGLLDTTSIDTAQWELGYNNFIKKVNPANRTIGEIESVVKKHEKAILDAIQYYANKLGIKNIDTVWFGLNSQGALMISSVKGKNIMDTNELDTVKNMLSSITFEPSRDGEYYCKFPTLINSANNIQVLRDIVIGEAAGRSKKDIMQAVMKKLPNMRYAYNRRIREKPGIKGKITVKYAINQYGQVIYAHLEASTVNDQLLNEAIIEQIKNWKFGFVYIKKEITELVYPFAFSQQSCK